MVPLAKASDPVYLLQSPLVIERTAQRVTRICRIDDDPAFTQNIDDVVDQSPLRCLRMYFKMLSHGVTEVPGCGVTGSCGLDQGAIRLWRYWFRQM